MEIRFQIRRRLTATLYLAPAWLGVWWQKHSNWKHGFVVRMLWLGFVIRWGWQVPTMPPRQWHFDLNEWEGVD